MKASMYYWKIKTNHGKSANYIADNGTIEDLTLLVNWGDNGLEERKKYTNRALKIFKRIINMKTTFILLPILCATFYVCAQETDVYNINSFNGIYINSNDAKNCHLLYNGSYIFFFLDEENDVDSSLVRNGTFGFYQKDINLENLTNLKFEKTAAEQDKLGFLSSTGGVIGYEYEIGGRSLNLYNQNAFFYQKLYVLPLKIINQLRIIARQKHIDIEKFLYSIETIGVQKATIFLAPNVISKMYLLKGDQLKILEEKNDWLKFEYKGKKIHTGWIRKKDLAEM